MSKLDPNAPAFSGPTKDGYTGGLTIMQFFTGMAMAGFIAACDVDPDMIAKQSVEIAKRTIEELNKPEIDADTGNLGNKTINGHPN